MTKIKGLESVDRATLPSSPTPESKIKQRKETSDIVVKALFDLWDTASVEVDKLPPHTKEKLKFATRAMINHANVVGKRR